MVAMDIAEVINPQFAFPVFGVVLCAVLVFAFGFKSVQPPNFRSFEDEGKKPKKPQKKAKKLQNGHIGGNELNGSPTSNSPKQTGAKQPPSSKQFSEKSESSKPKKKTPVTPKTTKVEKETKEEPAKEKDAGEWTTALSRKEKKMRGKKDDRQERYIDDWSDEPQAETSPVSPKPTDPVTEPTPEVGPGGDNAEVKKPLDQRSTRKDRRKKSAEAKTTEPTVGKPVVTATSVAVAAAGAVEDKKDEHENKETTTKPTVTPTKKQAQEDKVETSKVEGSPEKKSPKKKKKKSTRLPEQIDGAVSSNGTETGMPLEPSDVVAETTVPDAAAAIAEAMQESHDIESQNAESTQQQGATAFSTDSKPARSPKKKKKTKDREKEKVQPPSDPRSEASHTVELTESSVSSAKSRVASSTTSLSQTQPQTSGAATDRLNASSVEETSPAAQAEVASGTSKPSTSSKDQSKVTFDELGDWQEAKPVKKKKKARREN